jgi:hypothetical protein
MHIKNIGHASFAAAMIGLGILGEVLRAPEVEASWLGCGETSIMVAGSWALFAGIAVLFNAYACLAAMLTAAACAVAESYRGTPWRAFR